MADVHICLIEHLYDVICRDPDTAAGGLDPTMSDYHAEGFYRLDKDSLDKIKGSAIDRKVQILYTGSNQFGSLTNGIGNKRHKFINVLIRVGYYVGDRDAAASQIIGADEFLITKNITKPSNYPACVEGCVMGIDPLSSIISELDAERRVLEINLQCQIYQ